MSGNTIFITGATIEIVGLYLGVDSWAVAASLLAYGAVLLVTGYLS
ncbi:MAG: hypothetical protein ACRDZ4_21380 [Egibacteraceae bacterium]